MMLDKRGHISTENIGRKHRGRVSTFGQIEARLNAKGRISMGPHLVLASPALSEISKRGHISTYHSKD